MHVGQSSRSEGGGAEPATTTKATKERVTSLPAPVLVLGLRQQLESSAMLVLQAMNSKHRLDRVGRALDDLPRMARDLCESAT